MNCDRITRPGRSGFRPWRPAILALAVSVAMTVQAASPPTQPDSGPGGRDYAHLTARISYVQDGPSRYWLFEPAWPTPSQAPVLVYFAGVASGSGPYAGPLELQAFAEAYTPMFRHLARKGFTVILPAYGILGTPLVNYERNAIEATRRALRKLEGFFRVSPEPGNIALAGHSFGGLVILNIANRYAELDLPRPRALIGHEPALVSQIETLCAVVPGHSLCSLDIPDDYSNIDPDTLNVVIVGGQQRLAEMPATLAQWDLPQIPSERESLLFINGDRNGSTELRATHLTNGAHPWLLLAGFELDTLDWYGYWKPTEAALRYAFDGTHGEWIMNGGAPATYMGLWSDGTPFTPMSTPADFD